MCGPLVTITTQMIYREKQYIIDDLVGRNKSGEVKNSSGNQKSQCLKKISHFQSDFPTLCLYINHNEEIEQTVLNENEGSRI